MAGVNPLSDALIRARAAAVAATTAPHVLLIYDLHGATPAVYARLDHELRKLQYTKVVEDTTWEGRYQAGIDLDVAIEATKREFAESALRAGAGRYDLRVYGSAMPMKIATAAKP